MKTKNAQEAHTGGGGGIVGKKQDPRIQDPGFFRGKLGKILEIWRKKYSKLGKMLKKFG